MDIDKQTQDLLAIEVDDIFGEKRKEIDEKRKAQFEPIEQAFRNIAETHDGKVLFWWIMEQGHVFQTTFTGNSLSNFKEGERNMALKVLRNLLTVKPTILSDMLEDRIIPKEESNG